ncbi:hypothetical protein DF3PB_2730001 [uncultured Defluviicoccus sp.]|uniref:Calcium-binding protein n=1 Tax=metagenome TaxID=256318 RepID=A0A380TD21_9ZZZZ|nr:hypothetical protein DF3PB_2730001 [uncultured Defluviicoccus sp.]
MGTLLIGKDASVDAQSVSVGTGSNATGVVDISGSTLRADTLTFASGILDFHTATLTIGSAGNVSTDTLAVSGGLLTGKTISLTDGTLNFTGGTLAVDTVDGALTLKGGTLLPGATFAQTIVNGDASLASASTLRIDLYGSTFDASSHQYERLTVNGAVNLNADAGTGAKLDIHLGFTPTVGSTFTILANDGADTISSRFAGLLNGASFNVAYGTQTVTFQINYAGGSNANDIVLKTTAVSGAAPGGLTVTGTSGNDILTGSIGSDLITGGAGNDVLSGAAGSDVFAFASGFGSDRIRDFTPGADTIAFDASLGIANFAALDTNTNGVLDRGDAGVHVAGGDTLIVLGGNLIDVVGQTALVADDFQFAAALAGHTDYMFGA